MAAGWRLVETGMLGGGVMAAGLSDALLNNVVGLSILVIFAAAIMTAVLRSRARDRCLKDFRHFHVTLERQDGKLIWGRLRVYSSGFELQYRQPRTDPAGHVEASYILYGTQYREIRALYRFHDELTDANASRRRRSARRAYRRTVFRVIGRKIRNALNTLRDAVVQSMSVVVGQLKKASPGSSILATQDQQFVRVGSELVGVAGNAFDPILERYVGKRVVLQVQGGEGIVEYPGILKEYTADFLEVLNIPVRQRATVPPDGPDAPSTGAVRAQPRDGGLEVANKQDRPARVISISGDGWNREVDVEVTPGDTCLLEGPPDGGPALTALVEVTRPADVVVPRTIAVVRHAGPHERLNWETFLGLDRWARKRDQVP